LRIPKLPIKRNLAIASELITPEIGDTTNELPSATLARLLRLSEQTPADRIKTIPNSGAIIRSLQLSSKSQYTNFAISLVKSLPNNAKSADIIKAANNCFSGKITPHQDRKFNYDLVEFRNNCILMDYKSEDEGKIDHALISQSILFSEVIGLIKHHHALAGISTAASAKAVTINKEELSLAEENLNRHLLEVYREMRSEGRDDGCLVVL